MSKKGVKKGSGIAPRLPSGLGVKLLELGG